VQTTRPDACEASLSQAVAARAAQWQAFAEWEREQAQQAAPGPPDPAALARRLDWYADALAFARRVGSLGPGAPERHLEDLIAWVRRWRRAWGAD
jgi:hypothetical protein